MKLDNFCDRLIKGCLYFLVFALPTFFLPWTFEGFEFSKQNLLVVLTLIAALAWLGKMIAAKKMFFRKSFLNLLVLIYFLIYVLATIFSVDKFRSFVGSGGIEKEGLIAVFCFVLLYFVIINNVREFKTIRNLVYSLFLGAALAAVYGFLGFIGLLPATFLASRALNTVGSLSAFGIFLSAVFVLGSAVFLGAKAEPVAKRSLGLVILKVLWAVLAVLIIFLLASIDTWMIWASLVPAVALFLAFVVLKAHEIKNLSWLVLPMAALVIAVLLFFIRTPLNFGLPAEIMPSYSASGEIVKKTLSETPLLGSGPATFAFDWAKYKPLGVNQTLLWSTGFDRSASRVLTMLATAGLLGLVSWLFIIIFLAVQIISRVVREKTSVLWVYVLGLTSAWFLLLVAKFLYSSNLTLEFLFWVLTALLVALVSQKFRETSLEAAPRASLLLSFLLTLGLIFAVSSFYLVGQRYSADSTFRKAVLAAQQGEKIEKVVDYFNQAAGQNRWDDTYLANLAQSLLAQINQELGLEPNEERVKKIQNLIATDINIAKRITELSPKNSANWATLASIYQTIMPLIPGADQWAIDSWQKAIELEPNNPFSYTELGRTYVAVADLATPNLQSQDEKVKKEAEGKIKENLAKAEEQFNKAIELKLDYAPPHFELAMVYGRQGKIKEAISKLEALKAGLPGDIGVAFQLSLLYYQDKQQGKAVAELEQVIKLVPNFANARWYLAAIYEEQGKKDLAVAQLEEILKTNPENETVKQKLDALKAPPPEAPGAPLPAPISEEPKE